MITALFARPGERPVRTDKEGEIARRVHEGTDILWVDLFQPSEAELTMLSTVFRFHQLAIEDCIQISHHPKLDDYGDYLYMVVHGAESTGRRGQFKTQELDIFLGKNFLVTHRKDPIAAIDDTRKRCLEVEGMLAKGADFTLHDVLDALAMGYVRAIEAMDREVDGIETKIFKQPTNRVLAEIFALKKDILALRRVVIPQREILNRLSRSEFKQVSPAAGPFFRDVFDHIYRVSEMTESIRDIVTSALETYLTVVSNRMNEIMKVLTVISSILMTCALVAGIYGMNFKRMPELEWKYGYPMALGVMAVLASLMLVLFKKRKWI